MKLHSIKPAAGSVGKKKRLGRGQASGGSTAGRGHNGSQSRSGYSKKVGFEGGQMPLQRRIPKFGFKNNRKVYYRSINLDTLNVLFQKTKSESMDISFFVANGLVGKDDKIKILGRGSLKNKIKVEAHAVSASALQAIEKLGGSVTIGADSK